VELMLVMGLPRGDEASLQQESPKSGNLKLLRWASNSYAGSLSASVDALREENV
jgi:hypothetical protein